MMWHDKLPYGPVAAPPRDRSLPVADFANWTTHPNNPGAVAAEQDFSLEASQSVANPPQWPGFLWEGVEYKRELRIEVFNEPKRYC